MYTIHTRVGVCDTGADRLLSVGGASRMMIDCSYFWQESEPAFTAALKAANLGMFLVFRQMDIFRRPAFEEKLSVTTSIYATQRICGYRNTMIRDEKGALCIASYAVGAFVNFVTRRPAMLTPEVEATIKMDPKSEEMEYLPRHIALPQDQEAIPAGERIIQSSLLDMNGHVNSANYCFLAGDFAGDVSAYNRVRIEYRAQAIPALQKNLCFSLMDCPDRRIILIGDGGKTVNAVVEFSAFQAEHASNPSGN